MESLELIFLLVTVSIIIIVIMVIISLRNGIVSAKNRVKRSWADVIAWERKKLLVIPALEQGLKDYQAYEGDVMKQLTALRSSVDGLSSDKVDMDQLKESKQISKSLMAGLNVAVEAYPDLKTSGLYASWMSELSEAEENVTASISIFNANVQDFNNRIQEFPGNSINSMFNKESELNTFSDSKAEKSFEYKPNI